jgi:hypothetical protein
MIYHYTRLLPEEIEFIKINGLIPLSTKLFDLKERVLKERKINVEVCRSYLTTDETRDIRINRIFFTGYCALEDIGEVEDQLLNWGGEALYNHHENDDWHSAIQKESKPVVISVKDITTLKLYDEITDELLEDPTGRICYAADPIPPNLITIEDLSYLFAHENAGDNE